MSETKRVSNLIDCITQPEDWHVAECQEVLETSKPEVLSFPRAVYPMLSFCPSVFIAMKIHRK